jgi:hypothetical protein
MTPTLFLAVLILVNHKDGEEEESNHGLARRRLFDPHGWLPRKRNPQSKAASLTIDSE